MRSYKAKGFDIFHAPGILDWSGVNNCCSMPERGDLSLFHRLAHLIDEEP